MKQHLCVKCNEENPANFYGICKNFCKICYSKRVKENREKKAEYYKEYDRKRANLPHRVAKRKEISKKWNTDPELKKELLN